MSLTQPLKTQLWNAKRFGLWPDKLVRRLTSSASGRGICISIPKAGTHLLERALCLHPGLYRRLLPTLNKDNIGRYGGIEAVLARLRPGQLLFCHMRYREAFAQAIGENGVQAFFSIRDPRDVVVSDVHYILRSREHVQHEYFKSLKGFRERMMTIITGSPEHGQPSIAHILRAFEGWFDSDAFVVRFEDLVGERGGGDSRRQGDLLKRIYGVLGIDLTEAEVARFSEMLFSDASPTFRKGKAGAWREHFDDEVKDAFKSRTNDLLIRYGYEKDADW